MSWTPLFFFNFSFYHCICLFLCANWEKPRCGNLFQFYYEQVSLCMKQWFLNLTHLSETINTLMLQLKWCNPSKLRPKKPNPSIWGKRSSWVKTEVYQFTSADFFSGSCRGFVIYEFSLPLPDQTHTKKISLKYIIAINRDPTSLKRVASYKNN